MAESADRQLVTLTMDGADEHHGHVMARALVDKLDQFLKTFASFERAFLSAKTRQTDFEVVILSHSSPTEAGLNPVPRVRGYIPGPIVNWTLDQWDRITHGEKPDGVVDEDMVGEVVTLAKKSDQFGYANFFVRYNAKAINFNETALLNAEKLKLGMRAERPAPPWRPGVSVGTVTGELQDVYNADGERQVVICPFIGPARILCKFTEDMKERVRDGLFNIVRVSGLMHYGPNSPHPTLIEVESIDPVDVPGATPHMLEGRGLFKGGAYPVWASRSI